MEKASCRYCQKEYVLNARNFYKDTRRPGKFKKSICKTCFNTRYYKPEVYAKRAHTYNLRLRREVLEHYSKGALTCACCGEPTYEFLGIDHINGNGSKHRKELSKNGTTLYLYLRKHNYPEGYQVLCHNCNLSKGYYGRCPHESKF